MLVPVGPFGVQCLLDGLPSLRDIGFKIIANQFQRFLHAYASASFCTAVRLRTDRQLVASFVTVVCSVAGVNERFHRM